MVSLIVPFNREWKNTSKCIQTAIQNAETKIEVIVLDNTKGRRYSEELAELLRGYQYETWLYVKNEHRNANILKWGMNNSAGDIIGWVDNAKYLRIKGWDRMVEETFTNPLIYGVKLRGYTFYKKGMRTQW